ncbi:MAG: hypothetical protein HY260_03240 [Chloroflexi bacterium]|nr:hypothetical protein [Chloroflexota bacterium]
MSPLRRFLVILGLILLLASLGLLIAANWPNERLREQQPIPAENLTLPTPQAFVAPSLCLSISAPGGEAL